MQYSDDHDRIFLLKMEILAYGEEDEKLREFNREQLIHHRSQLAKSIRKGMEETNLLVQYRCVFQLSSETAAVVGEQYLTVVKKYVLIT